MKSSSANEGDHNHTVCFKGGSRKYSVVATKILPLPQAINNDRSLKMQAFLSFLFFVVCARQKGFMVPDFITSGDCGNWG